MVGRLIGSVCFGKINPRKTFITNAIVAIVVMAIAMIYPNKSSAMALVALGLLNSIMYPVIFSLALAKVGHLKERALGLLIMAGVGGAIIPLLQTYTSELTTMANSFVIPACCYLFISLPEG